MTEYDQTINKLRAELEAKLTPRRLKHTQNVLEKAIELADKYGEDKQKVELGVLAHDLFREIDDEELKNLCKKYKLDDEYSVNNALSHGHLSTEYIRDVYDIHDEDILSSIRYHTTGRPDMSRLEKIIFLADAIEKDRNYDGVDKIRSEAEKGLDYGVKESLANTIEHLTANKRHIHKDTIDAFKFYEEHLK